MKECNKFIDSLILYYNPPDYNSLADYNPPDLISAEEVGIRKGWKAALRWVLSRVDALNFSTFPTTTEAYTSIINDIEKELEE